MGVEQQYNKEKSKQCEIPLKIVSASGVAIAGMDGSLKSHSRAFDQPGH